VEPNALPKIYRRKVVVVVTTVTVTKQFYATHQHTVRAVAMLEPGVRVRLRRRIEQICGQVNGARYAALRSAVIAVIASDESYRRPIARLKELEVKATATRYACDHLASLAETISAINEMRRLESDVSQQQRRVNDQPVQIAAQADNLLRELIEADFLVLRDGVINLGRNWPFTD
jgi:hypothetical protein